MNEKQRVIILEGLPPEGIEVLLGGGLEIEDGTGWDEAELLHRIPGCRGLIVGPTRRVAADVLRAGSELKVVGRTGAGVDNVDVAEATRRGIVVADTPQSDLVSAAERALALILLCAHHVTDTHADLRAGRWEPLRWAQSNVEVRGRTLGLVGVGLGAPLLAEGAVALGMKVVACDPTVPQERLAELPLEALGDCGRVYAEADLIVVDLQDGAATAGLIGADQFAQMTDGVRFVSLSRTGVVDPVAWARAIESGKVVASAATVYAGDPHTGELVPGHPEVLLTPHLDESTVDARVRAGLMIAEQVTAVLRGELAGNAVNVPLSLVDDAEELMPYLGLCVQLGRMLVGLVGSPVAEVEISYGGSFAYFDTGILTLGVLSGVLSDRVEGRVNYVNVQSIAEQYGVSAREAKQSDLPDYPRLITVSTAGPEGQVSVSGTSLGAEHKPRLVRVFGEDIDIDPAPHMLFLRYVDAPGLGGAVGTLLGEWGVNIRHMSVGRGAGKRDALMALTLDEPLDASRIGTLVTSCGLTFGKGVEL